jgi:hypothetical protein
MQLSKLETDAQLDVPRDAGGLIKRLANDPAYRLAWEFITQSLCGVRRLSFVPGAPEATEIMYWREGRRFVGEQLLRIAETPMPAEEAPEPPARTMTERAARRQKAKPPRA